MTKIRFRKKAAKMGDRKIITIPPEWLHEIDIGTIYEIKMNPVEVED